MERTRKPWLQMTRCRVRKNDHFWIHQTDRGNWSHGQQQRYSLLWLWLWLWSLDSNTSFTPKLYPRFWPARNIRIYIGPYLGTAFWSNSKILTFKYLFFVSKNWVWEFCCARSSGAVQIINSCCLNFSSTNSSSVWLGYLCQEVHV